jgi:S1-C subfamily serine protease
MTLRESVGLPPVPALLVRTVAEGGPAAQAGIRTGDLLVSAGEIELRSAAALHAAIQTATGRLDLRLLRGADERRVTVALADGAPPVAGRAARGEHAV